MLHEAFGGELSVYEVGLLCSQLAFATFRLEELNGGMPFESQCEAARAIHEAFDEPAREAGIHDKFRQKFGTTKN